MTAPTPTAVEQTLAYYSELTRTAMAARLPSGEPQEYLYQLIRDYPDRGGKRLRPAILLATCQAYGRQYQDALSAAVSIEMLHNAFLIHDDIEDNSRIRRHRPTLHEIHGVALALNAGDALAAAALRPLLDDRRLSSRLRQLLLDEFSEVVRQTTEGQALELGWRKDNVTDLAPTDYIELAGKKTCWYTTVAPLRMGAIIGSHGTAGLRALSRFGFYLGLAFQTRDDLLDLQPQLLHGKSPLGDIREGKPTLLLVHLLVVAEPSDSAWLRKFLTCDARRRSAADCRHVVDLMHAYGSVEFTENFGAEMAAAAGDSFSGAFAGVPESEHLSFLRELTRFVLQRTS